MPFAVLESMHVSLLADVDFLDQTHFASRRRFHATPILIPPVFTHSFRLNLRRWTERRVYGIPVAPPTGFDQLLASELRAVLLATK
jgi:hypothetical protein